MDVTDLKKQEFVIVPILHQPMEEGSVLDKENKEKLVLKKRVPLIVNVIPGKIIGQGVYQRRGKIVEIVVQTFVTEPRQEVEFAPRLHTEEHCAPSFMDHFMI